MTEYVTPLDDSQLPPLVYSGISQQNEDDRVEIFPSSVRFKSPSTRGNRTPPVKTAVSSFTPESRRRLRFASLNAHPALTCQFGMTYGHQWPSDGKIAKKQLNHFLTKIRRKFGKIPYLWILEFQSRGAPHFHLFMNIEPSKENREWLAGAWWKIIDPAQDNPKIYSVHSNPKNFIKWDMGSGTYLTKYLDKDAQKCVPEQFDNVGRFWGHSSGMVPEPITLERKNLDEAFTEIDEETGEIREGFNYIKRTIGRYHEKITNGYSRARKSGSYTIPTGAKIYRQLENSLNRKRTFSRSSVSIYCRLFEDAGKSRILEPDSRESPF